MIIKSIDFDYSNVSSLVVTNFGTYEVLKHVALKLELLIGLEIKIKPV